jgi:hypothetical protein
MKLAGSPDATRFLPHDLAHRSDSGRNGSSFAALPPGLPSPLAVLPASLGRHGSP